MLTTHCCTVDWKSDNTRTSTLLRCDFWLPEITRHTIIVARRQQDDGQVQHGLTDSIRNGRGGERTCEEGRLDYENEGGEEAGCTEKMQDGGPPQVARRRSFMEPHFTEREKEGGGWAWRWGVEATSRKTWTPSCEAERQKDLRFFLRLTNKIQLEIINKILKRKRKYFLLNNDSFSFSCSCQIVTFIS